MKWIVSKLENVVKKIVEEFFYVQMERKQKKRKKRDQNIYLEERSQTLCLDVRTNVIFVYKVI